MRMGNRKWELIATFICDNELKIDKRKENEI